MKIKQRGFISCEAVLVIGSVALLVLLFGLIAYDHHEQETVRMPAAYAAWVKLTGNPKELTFKEWRSLVRAKEDQATDTPAVIPIYIPQ